MVRYLNICSILILLTLTPLGVNCDEVCQDCAGATKIVYPGNDSVCGNDGGSVNVSTFITKGGCTVTMTCEDEGSVACVQFQSNSSCGCLGTNETTFICSGGILNLISEGVFENQLVPVTAGYCTKKMSSPGICLTGLALNATTQVVNKTMGSVTKLIKDILAGGIGSKTLEQLIPHLTNFANDMVEIAKNGSTSVGDILGGGIDFIKDVDGNIRGIISNFQDEAKNCETKSFLTKLICLTSLAVYIPGKLIPIVSDTIDMLTCK